MLCFVDKTRDLCDKKQRLNLDPERKPWFIESLSFLFTEKSAWFLFPLDAYSFEIQKSAIWQVTIYGIDICVSVFFLWAALWPDKERLETNYNFTIILDIFWQFFFNFYSTILSNQVLSIIIRMNCKKPVTYVILKQSKLVRF